MREEERRHRRQHERDGILVYHLSNRNYDSRSVSGAGAHQPRRRRREMEHALCARERRHDFDELRFDRDRNHLGMVDQVSRSPVGS